MGLLIAYRVLAIWVRFPTLALAAILSVPAVGLVASHRGGAILASSEAATTPTATSARSLDALLQSFYASERRRRVTFDGTPDAGYDPHVVQICSLGWDDLAFEKPDFSNLMPRFDAVFTRFNGAVTYSGPAMLRLIAGVCGQESHKALYDGTPADCNVFDAFEKIGYRKETLLNHNGQYGDFKGEPEHDGLEGPVELGHVGAVALHSFDGTPIDDDYEVLAPWWKERLARDGNKRVALYYNTITLHDGNKVVGMLELNSVQSYVERVTRLGTDLKRFVNLLESSGRPVILVVVAEHGAALRGSRMLLSGMREIPGPFITLIPAAIRIINGPAASGGDGARAPVQLQRPSAYNDLFGIVDRVLAHSQTPIQTADWRDWAREMAGTRFVADGGDGMMLRDDAGMARPALHQRRRGRRRVQAAAGLNRSTRLVTMPSVPSSIRRRASSVSSTV